MNLLMVEFDRPDVTLCDCKDIKIQFLFTVYSLDFIQFLFQLSESNCIVFNYVFMYLLLLVKGRQRNFLFKD